MLTSPLFVYRTSGASTAVVSAARPGRATRASSTPVSRNSLQVPREPVAHAVPRVDLVLALGPAVAFARVDDELRLAARLDEGVVELERLRERRAEVVLAVEDQRRGLALRRVVERRAFRVLAARIERVGLQVEPAELPDVGREVEADPIGDDRKRHRGREAVGLRDRPAGHEAAVAPAGDRDAVELRDPVADECLDAREDVLQVSAAHVSEVGLCELRAAPDAAADIRKE